MCNQANTIQGKQNNYQKEFAEFVKNCIHSDGTLLTVTKDLFTIENLKATKSFLRHIKPLFDIKNEEARKQNKQAKKKIVKTWGIGDIFDGGVFSEFFKDVKNNEIKQNVIEVLLHCNWLMYLCSDRQHRQASNLYKKDTDKYFKVNTEWAIGPTFSGTSLDAMLFIVELILKVKENTENKNITDNIKKIENLCNDDEWKKGLKWNDQDHKSTISTEAIVNIILFFCDNEKYLPIPAQNKKDLISKKLKDIVKNVQQSQQDFEGVSTIDQNLFRIREELRTLTNSKDNSQLYPEPNPFWHNTIRPFWDDSTEKLDKEQLSDKTLMEYKKAMILYGPPGTSKSYQARKMAEGMIAEALRNNSANISEAISNLQKTLDSHIHVLQMHPNYTYDDFIIGKSINENEKIVVKPGKMLQIIKGIDTEDKIPHFVILDEINRVDISRVFGELFTAMEASYRDKGVELSMNINDIPEKEREELQGKGMINDGNLYLRVPNNMYFIGSMNMIDFSLEQVDFALRRRFLWRLSTYDPKRLDEIISEKIENEIKEKPAQIKTVDEPIKAAENINIQDPLIKELNNILRKLPDNFSKTCTDLNNEIEWESSLGKSYLIGHAFFAEIVDIVKQVKDWEKAKNVLWQVSILPTLEAYCGTMDANMQETFLTRCKDAFMPELKEDKKKKK